MSRSPLSSTTGSSSSSLPCICEDEQTPFTPTCACSHACSNHTESLSHNHEAAPPVPAHIPRYTREQLDVASLRLAHGAFSNVFVIRRIHHQKTDDDDDEDDNNNNVDSSNLVLKQARVDVSPRRRAQALRDLTWEAHFLATLQHKHILSLQGIVGPDHSLLLPRVTSSLTDRLQDYKFQAQVYPGRRRSHAQQQQQLSLVWMRQLASAMQYMHAHSIVYRDLKPDNVGLVGNNNNNNNNTSMVQLLDLGLARQLDADGYCYTAVGTRRYMAPEVALRRPYHLQADVYSMALVIWEVLTWKKPYEDQTDDVHLQRVCHEGVRPRVSNHWPKAVQRLLVAAWAGDACQRPTMADVHAQLQEICESQSSAASIVKDDSWSSRWRLSSRHWWGCTKTPNKVSPTMERTTCCSTTSSSACSARPIQRTMA